MAAALMPCSVRSADSSVVRIAARAISPSHGLFFCGPVDGRENEMVEGAHLGFRRLDQRLVRFTENFIGGIEQFGRTHAVFQPQGAWKTGQRIELTVAE
jgi:hypothetical protein